MSAEAVQNRFLETRSDNPPPPARVAKAHLRRVAFARRHPIVTYLILPVPGLVLLWIVYTLGLAGVLKGFQSYKDAVWAVTAAGVLVHGLAYVPAVLATLVVAWITRRSGTRILWWLVASLLIAAVSSLMIVTFRMPTAPGTGMLQIGLGFPPDFSRWPQFLVPLAVALALASGMVMRRRSWRWHAST